MKKKAPRKSILNQKIDIGLTPAEGQWISSFLFFDVIVWGLSIFGVIITGGSSAEGLTFLFPLFYAPFWLFLPSVWIGQASSAGYEMILLPIIGVAGHAGLGWATAKLLGDWDTDTVTSKAVAFLVLLSLITVSTYILRATGAFI
jgi:hypothetical protein